MTNEQHMTAKERDALLLSAESVNEWDREDIDMTETAKQWREACECPPVHGALIGLALLLQYERSTGHRVVPSQDARPELAALRALVDDITTKLDAADDTASGETIH
ncbi:hypothetical protein [Paraburkholderia sp.]|uniref:hypothetical protein n=1 Tax=Paraburkholderia sp. TaxID=1926495 RepID=UPI0039E4D06E